MAGEDQIDGGKGVFIYHYEYSLQLWYLVEA